MGGGMGEGPDTSVPPQKASRRKVKKGKEGDGKSNSASVSTGKRTTERDDNHLVGIGSNALCSLQISGGHLERDQEAIADSVRSSDANVLGDLAANVPRGLPYLIGGQPTVAGWTKGILSTRKDTPLNPRQLESRKGQVHFGLKTEKFISL
jgi:hypothetical protein